MASILRFGSSLHFECFLPRSCDECRDSAAFKLKFVAMVSILVAGVCGIALPLVGTNSRILPTDENLFFFSESICCWRYFWLRDCSYATEALTDPCLPAFPWQKFPFPGFCAMISALATLLADFIGTQYYERTQEQAQLSLVEAAESDSEPGIVRRRILLTKRCLERKKVEGCIWLIAVLYFHQFFEGLCTWRVHFPGTVQELLRSQQQ